MTRQEIILLHKFMKLIQRFNFDSQMLYNCSKCERSSDMTPNNTHQVKSLLLNTTIISIRFLNRLNSKPTRTSIVALA